MKCKYCGKEHLDTANFCPFCGKTVEKEPEAPEPETPEVNEAEGFKPIPVIGFLLSAISFLAGFILFTIMLANKIATVGVDTLVFLPAFAGLVFDIYAFSHARAKKKKLGMIISFVSLALVGFTIFYGFVTYCVFLG